MTTYSFSVPVFTSANGTISAARSGQIDFVVQDDVSSFSYRSYSTASFLDLVSLVSDGIYGLHVDGLNVLDGMAGDTQEFGQMTWDNQARSTYVYSISVPDGEAADSYFLEVGGAALPNMTTVAGARGFFSRLTWAAGASRGSGYGSREDISLTDIPGVRISQDDVIYVSMGAGLGEVNAGIGDDTIIPDELNSAAIDGGDGQDLLRFTGYSANAFDITWQGDELRLEDSAMPFDEGGEQMQIRNVEQFEFARVGGGIDTFSLGQLRSLAIRAEAVDSLGTEFSETMRGGNNHDRLVGLAGNDTLWGGDGADTLNGGDGDDSIVGGEDLFDERDTIYAGAGDDFANGGYGNDLMYGGAGNDILSGNFGADEIFGQQGQDALSGGAFSDQLFGGDGDDYINGGFGFDRVNGGEGADRFFHLGVADHGADWIQDYDAAEGDVLQFGNAAALAGNFQINFTETENAGSSGVAEAFVIYRPTGQILWALIDAAGQDEIYLQIGGQVFDLMA